MKTYYVSKNDHRPTMEIRGCFVSTNPQAFRKVPITAVIWTATVRAETPIQAVNNAHILKREQGGQHA